MEAISARPPLPRMPECVSCTHQDVVTGFGVAEVLLWNASLRPISLNFTVLLGGHMFLLSLCLIQSFLSVCLLGLFFKTPFLLRPFYPFYLAQTSISCTFIAYSRFIWNICSYQRFLIQIIDTFQYTLYLYFFTYLTSFSCHPKQDWEQELYHIPHFLKLHSIHGKSQLWWSTYCLPDNVLGIFRVLNHLTLTTTYDIKCYCSPTFCW